LVPDRRTAASGGARVRALVLTPDFPPAWGGIQLLVHRLVHHLREIDAGVLTLDSRGSHEFDRGEPLQIRRVRRARPLGHSIDVGLLNAIALLEARRFRPDVVLSAHIVTSPAAWAIQRMIGVPFVQYLYADEVPGRQRLASFAARHAAAVVAISTHTEAIARSCGADPARIYRIAPGVDPANADRSERSAQPLLVTVSRLADRYKGHDVLIEAMRLVVDQVPGVRWVVVGDGPLRSEYERLVSTNGLDDRVRFVGWVTNSERDAWLDRAHVFALPSRLRHNAGGEGFGIVYLEAGAHGLPVIAGNVGGAVDAVVDGVTGLLVDPLDARAVADAICHLLLHPVRAEAMGREGRARARQFAWSEVGAKVEALLLQVAGVRT
jgi:phosphatidylinositol alpha-1,6-mannosyltransferase